MKTFVTKLLAAIAVSLLPFTNLIAAEMEEIVVTATKRGEVDVQSLGAAIYAITGDNLENKNQIDFEEFAASVPGLHFQDLGPGDKEYIIRGINGNGPAVVGAYFDEYVITANDQQDGGGKNAPIKLVDLERVEVLNGPQGTLYGANSMAGNIKYIPRKPDTQEFNAFINSDFSDTTDGGFG
ncbi:MAG: TonB-dependent receptor plug domain-containing protein, partial [Woeseiaceae bacterium]